MSDSQEPLHIEFQCIVEKVQTIADNSIRLTLDLPETEWVTAALLMACKSRGIVLRVDATPDRPSMAFELEHIAEELADHTEK